MSVVPRVSIVIVSWNVRELLRSCLASIRDCVTTPVEVIVVDNASSDGTVEMVHQYFPHVHCIANTVNVGFARANNQARDYAHGEMICFLNPDTVIEHDIFATMVPWMMQQERVGAVGCELLNSDRTHQQSVRAFPRLADQLTIAVKMNWLLKKASWMKRYYADPGSGHREPIRVDQIMGAMMLIPSQVLTEVGWFDEGYPNWFEEVDLCQRLHRAKYAVWYYPGEHIIHHGGSSFGQVITTKKHRWFLTGLRRYTKTYWPKWQALCIDLASIVSYGLTMVQLAVKPR